MALAGFMLTGLLSRLVSAFVADVPVISAQGCQGVSRTAADRIRINARLSGIASIPNEDAIFVTDDCSSASSRVRTSYLVLDP
ncbi:hypothetical protein C7401_11944 [Paraburkholderia unamae]|uniref:hypothetical protein n=1 Tax=Paraburkholderia unamae TaxID=219649 RepID=UPI000DC39195|nr:hypothetical protein [Paraburkholderia unamae]RAR56395.1 hypothetical protein C7401_11944 [Paraburkholderia unamae]